MASIVTATFPPILPSTAPPVFQGLSAFPLTPMNGEGVVDTDAFGLLLDRLVAARVDSIGVLGSTGLYAYLDRAQRARAVAAAVEVAAGRIPVIVGVAATRTSWVLDLVTDAERAGADGLLLAPMSYLPLTESEVADHYRTIAAATRLPLCIYNNPTTTRFAFSESLIADLAHVPGIAAIKMPLPSDGDVAVELARLRTIVPNDFAIGYSGDWGAAAALSAGCDAWFSVIAGLLPEPALRLTSAARSGDSDALGAAQAALEPLWAIFRTHGSLRALYAIADRLGLELGDPPLPLQRLARSVLPVIEAALDRLGVPQSAK